MGVSGQYSPTPNPKITLLVTKIRVGGLPFGYRFAHRMPRLNALKRVRMRAIAKNFKECELLIDKVIWPS